MYALILFLFSTVAFSQINTFDRISSVTHVRGTAEIAVAEASDFTAVADVAGSLGGTYFKFYSAGDTICYAPWFDVDDGDTAPTVTGCTVVEIDIEADDTAATIAGLVRTELNASPYTTHFVITGATDHVIVTNVLKGAATDGNIGTSTFSVSKTQGVSASRAIIDASVSGNVAKWKICNDAVVTSTYLVVGTNALDANVNGVALGKGKCFECEYCKGSILKTIYVSSQAAANPFTVIQYKK